MELKRTNLFTNRRYSFDPDWALPTASVIELKPKRAKYAVVIPLINEGERITEQLRRTEPYLSQVDVVLADGGSTDGSTELNRLQSAGVRALLRCEGKSTFGIDLRLGFAYALAEGYSGIILMDGNNKDNPSALPRFAKELDDNYDFIQGSRFLPGGKAEHTPLLRWILIRLVHAPFLSLFAGFRFTDTTNGFRAFSRNLLLDPRVRPFRAIFRRYELPYYLAVRAPELKFRVKEIPVERVYPAHGPTPTKITAIRGNWRMLSALLKACFRMQNPAAKSIEPPTVRKNVA